MAASPLERIMRRLQIGMLLTPLLLGLAFDAAASELAYTYMDFTFFQQDVVGIGTQDPVPGQTVDIVAGDGDGIAIAGGLALGDRFYLGGSFESAIIEVAGEVSNQFGTVSVTDDFDLIRTRLHFGYLREIGENLDVYAELSYDSAEYDFGSFAGENFDMDDSGAGLRLGFRWNPRPRFEIFGSARHLTAGKLDLSKLEFESDTLVQLGLRWYFFEDLAVGIEHEEGEVSTTSLSMRFSFGTLPW
jgi:hypothetical protein